MLENEITLEELSERTGVEPRTLRSWVSEGLLSPPLRTGRGACYPASNAERALAVRNLKSAHGLSLAEIGRRFMMASENQIREWALEVGPTSAPQGSARDYLRTIQARKIRREAGLTSTKEVSPHPSYEPGPPLQFSTPSFGKYSRYGGATNESATELANIERLILQLERVLGTPAPKRSRGSLWTRISITPDLELSVRGDLSPHERVLFEQLADQFRAILIGKTKDE